MENKRQLICNRTKIFVSQVFLTTGIRFSVGVKRRGAEREGKICRREERQKEAGKVGGGKQAVTVCACMGIPDYLHDI